MLSCLGRQRAKGKSLRASRLKTKKSRNRNTRFRLYLFLYEVLCNDFPTVDTPRRPCYHSPNEKSKNTRDYFVNTEKTLDGGG